MSDYIFTQDEILVFKLFPSYLFFLITFLAGLLLWARIGFINPNNNLSIFVALPFAALLVSVPVTYGLSLWKRRKLSKLSSVKDISSSVNVSHQIKWCDIKQVGLSNWQLSISTTDGRQKNLFLGLAQSTSAERFIKSKVHMPWSILQTRYYLVFVSLALVILDMALLVDGPSSWPIFVGEVILMSFAFGLMVYAVARPKITEVEQYTEGEEE